MTRPRLLILSLGGTSAAVPDANGGITPKLDAAQLVASVPELAEVAQIEAHSPHRLPGPSLEPGHLVEVAKRIEDAFAAGFDGAVVVQGTDTLEESAFLLDLLVADDKPVVVTSALHGMDGPGTDHLLAAARVATSSEAHGLGTLAVLNYDIHAARFVQKSHMALPSAFASSLAGPIGVVAEGRPRFYTRVRRLPCLPSYGGPPRPVALLKWAMGEDGRLLEALPGLRYAGAVIEAMGAGHVPAEAAPPLGQLALRMPVVLVTRAMAGPAFTRNCGYPGSQLDLLGRGLVPAGFLSGLKARLLLGLALRGDGGGQSTAAAVFANYH